jgi:WD40 repeat protein
VGPSGDLVLRDPTTFEPIRSFAGDDAPSHTYAYQYMAFSDDDHFLVTTYEGTGRLWDVETGRAIGAPIPSLASSQPAALRGVHPGLLTMSDDWVMIWNLDVDTWRDIACQAAGRNLTQEEWDRFGPQDQPYHATCAQWPAAVGATDS